MANITIEVDKVKDEVIFINRLEIIRLELGFKTKRSFAEWLEVAETDYSRWSKQKVQPSMGQFIYLRNQISRRRHGTQIDHLVFEVPK